MNFQNKPNNNYLKRIYIDGKKYSKTRLWLFINARRKEIDMISEGQEKSFQRPSS